MTVRGLSSLLALACACSVSTQGLSGGDASTGETSTTTTTDPTTTAASTGEHDVPASCTDLHPRALGVLEANCARCHGAGSIAQGGIDYILDVEALIANDKIVPGQPDMSRVHVRMASPDTPMPPVDEAQRPSANDVVAVHDWIERCLAVDACDDPVFITTEELLLRINQDLASLPQEVLPFTRYFSFVHLHNAGLCEPEIELRRQALAKLVNSLSQGLLIKTPQAIDDARLIYRIDTGDYAWQAGPVHQTEPSHYYPNDPFVPSESGEPESERAYNDIWEMIAFQDPYNVFHVDDDVGVAIVEQTHTFNPVMHGDAFIDVASRAPLYYDILGIPRRSGQLRPEDPPCQDEQCLETQLGLNLLADIDDEIANDDEVVARAGLHQSNVSDFNRVVERHQFPMANNRSLWLAYDFNSQSGTANIGEHPLDFAFDATTVLYTLPNGLLGFMATDGDGRRRNEAPLNILHDESQADFLVRAGVSCMGCHDAGVQHARDDVRYDLDEGQTDVQFDEATKDQIRRLYPTREAFDAVLQVDAGDFAAGVEKCGVSIGDPEPVLASFLVFDEDLDLRRAAAELGLTADQLLEKLGLLSSNMMQLAEPGGTILRRVFTDEYARSVCLLGVGRTRCCISGDLDPAC